LPEEHDVHVYVSEKQNPALYGSSAMPLANARGSENFGSSQSEPRALASGTVLEANIKQAFRRRTKVRLI